jgi:hypothetical protein
MMHSSTSRKQTRTKGGIIDEELATDCNKDDSKATTEEEEEEEKETKRKNLFETFCYFILFHIPILSSSASSKLLWRRWKKLKTRSKPSSSCSCSCSSSLQMIRLLLLFLLVLVLIFLVYVTFFLEWRLISVPNRVLVWCGYRSAPTMQLISHPKCGRTWLRLMLGYILVSHFHLEEDLNFLKTPSPSSPSSSSSPSYDYNMDKMLKLELEDLRPDIPVFDIRHRKSKYETEGNYEQWPLPNLKNTNVLLLIRDPR